MQNKKYQHLFFDLDRTLWDFNANSKIVLEQLYRDYQLQTYFGSFLFFYSRFEYHNNKLWQIYYRQGITKEKLVYQRFYITLKEAGYDDLDIAKTIAADYLTLSPLQTKLFPFVHETLQALKQRGLQLYIITNGFTQVQTKKLANCNLQQYFTQMITSEEVGVSKPDIAIFQYALNKANATSANSLMIGDDLKTDIGGARNAGIDQVYCNYQQQNHQENPTYEISNLQMLLNLLR